MNDLPHNRVSQIFFALEVMKQCAFGRARFINDAIETTALKSVFVKFVKRSLEDFSSRVFRFLTRTVESFSSLTVNATFNSCARLNCLSGLAGVSEYSTT